MRRAAPLVLALALAGCGLGAGRTPGGVELAITQNFGAAPLKQLSVPKIAGHDTVMRLLERNAAVTTRYGGGFVESINGLGGGQRGGRPVDWFYYVNGIEAHKGAAATVLHDGDHVWWDRHDWAATTDVPAVVGSYPEPFLHGEDGRRLPTRIECTDPQSSACAMVSHALTGLGIPAARGGIGLAEYNDSLRVLVGPWAALRGDAAAAQLAKGPQTGGVYARFERGGATLVLLDEAGAAGRAVGAGSGLVAATRYHGAPPVWLVTGTDTAGVTAAAQAFDAGTLQNRFAVAVVNDIGVPLPLGSVAR